MGLLLRDPLGAPIRQISCSPSELELSSFRLRDTAKQHVLSDVDASKTILIQRRTESILVAMTSLCFNGGSLHKKCRFH